MGALVRTFSRTAHEISADIQQCSEEDAQVRIRSLLAPNWETQSKTNPDAPQGDDEQTGGNHGEASAGGDDSDAEITCVISNKLRLRCPLSFERVQIPVRGVQCMHLQCFGLGAYLESNSKMRAMNNRWTCPVCSIVLRPQDLRIDSYVERVLVDTPESVEEVVILQDGTYRVVEEDDDMHQPSASPGGADANEEDALAPAAEDNAEMPTVEAVIFSVDEDAKKKRKDLLQFETLAEKRQKRRQRKAQEAAAAAAVVAVGTNGVADAVAGDGGHKE